MRYKFIEIGSDHCFFNASLYHDFPDTCVYMFQYRYNTYLESGKQEYHYKAYRLFNNELSNRVFFKLNKKLVSTTSSESVIALAHCVNRQLENQVDKHANLEYADTFFKQDIIDHSEIYEMKNDFISIDINKLEEEDLELEELIEEGICLTNEWRYDKSGLINFQQDNTWPEIHSPTGAERKSNDALTFLYETNRKRGDMFGRIKSNLGDFNDFFKMEEDFSDLFK